MFYRENTTLRVCPKFIASAELKYPAPRRQQIRSKALELGGFFRDKEWYGRVRGQMTGLVAVCAQEINRVGYFLPGA